MTDAPALLRRFLLALAVWREARSEPAEGQQLVAQVIQNRVADPRWPKTYTGVILQPLQFSAFNAHDPNAVKFPKESDLSWLSAVDAADLVLAGHGPKTTANHYHVIGIWPDWADATKEVARVGHHVFYALCLLLCLSLPLHAEEPTPFRWPSHAVIPQRISDGAVIANLSLDAWASLYKTDATTKRNYLCRSLLTVGIAELTKALVHRTRPDGSDQKSFFSEHTALASTAAHSPLTASLAVSVGWGRQASGRHYATDVSVGAAVGLVARKVCQ